MTRLLTRGDVASLLSLAELIDAVEDVLRRHGAGAVAAPQSLGTVVDLGGFHVKTAVTESYVAKVNANFPGNPSRHGLPTIQGVVAVFDASRGVLRALMDSGEITTLRTAAATAVAARHLARADATVATIVGCGVQGRAHLAALLAVRPVRRVFAVDRDEEVAAAFAAEASRAFGVDVVSGCALDDAVRRSDVVVTCTPSRRPLLEARHLRDGMFIAGVGADHPEKNELSPNLLASSRVVPDLLDQAAKMGDLHHALDAGAMTPEAVHGELPDVLCGRVPARLRDDETFVFDSTGTALQDAVAATLALSRAEERGVGLDVDLAGPSGH